MFLKVFVKRTLAATIACCFTSAYAIGNGTDVPQGKYPFFAVFDIDKTVPISNTVGWCGGALIDKNWVLTAKHCYAEESSPKNIRLIIGSADLSDPTSYQIAYATKLFYAPSDPVIDPAKGTPDDYWQANDLLLIKLDHAIDLPTIEIADFEPKTGETAIVMGRGWTETGQFPSPKLREVTLPIVNANYCDSDEVAKSWPPIMRMTAGRDICSGFHNGEYIGAGSGDSGGPLIQFKNGKYYLIGTVARGLPLESPDLYGGIYMDVSSQSINSWIKDTINANY